MQKLISNSAITDMDGKEYYEITIKGHIDKQRGVFFRQMKIFYLLSGETCIAGYVKDQADLYNILTFIRDMGIPLIKVELKQLNPEEGYNNDRKGR